MIQEYNPNFSNNENYKKLIKMYGDELGALQREAHDLEIPIIIVFEGWYDIFIGEIVNRQLLPLDSRGFDFYFTDAPTSEENKIPFIYRFAKKIPPKGKIAVFDRSWYMRGLIEYLLNDSDIFGCSNLNEKTNIEAIFMTPANKNIINTPKFNKLIQTINHFEKILTDNGTHLIKIYFGVRKERRRENRKRLEKIFPYNIDRRYTEKIYKKDIYVVKEVIEQTNTENAPWNLYFADKELDEATAGTMKILIQEMKKIIENVKIQNEIQKEIEKSCEISETDSNPLTSKPGPLDQIDLSKAYTKKEYKKYLEICQNKLAYSHYSLFIQKKPMVLVFEGWDAAGKGSSIKRIVQAMNPRYYRVIPIGSPTEVDNKYPYLWRFLDGIPPCGKTSIFDRSWYGRVMVERIEGFCNDNDWKRAYEEINHFEETMTDSGMIVIKFWLHVSKEKQYERFIARSLNPYKQWKLTDEDWRNREKWDEYYAAVNEMIERTNTKEAPWVVVEADDKYYARIKILKTIIKRIEKESGNKIKNIDFPIQQD